MRGLALASLLHYELKMSRIMSGCKKQMDSGRLPIHILKQVFFDLDPRFKGDDARTKIDGCIGKNILRECVTPRRYTSHDEQERVPI